jgi:hypothetical protein
MRLICPIIFAIALLAAAPAGAAPRFTLLASDGTGYAVDASREPGQPVTFALSDDLGSGVVENQVPVPDDRVMRVGASARCLPGGLRLLRVYGTVAPGVRRVVAQADDGQRFALRRAETPKAWRMAGSVIGRVVELRSDRLRLEAVGARGAQAATLTVSFAQPCPLQGTRAMAAEVLPGTVDLDTAGLTARLTLPARSAPASYAINLLQPGWSPSRAAFAGSPWGSPLGPAGDVTLDGPGTLEGAEPALAQIGDVCLRGAAKVVNTVIVRLAAGQATTVVWPLALSHEPHWDTTRLQAAFRVRRGDFESATASNTIAYSGPLGVRFALGMRKRGSRATVTGRTFPALRNRSVTVYVLQARDRGAGEQLLANDFRPYKTLRTRTDSRGRFTARYPVTSRAYRVVAEAGDTPSSRLDDRSCHLERDWR